MKRISLFMWCLVIAMVALNSCSDLELTSKDQVGGKQDLNMSSLSMLSKKIQDSTRQAEAKVLQESANSSVIVQPNAIAPPANSINYALQAKVSAESTFPGYSVGKINDGSRTITVGGAYSWANNYAAGGKLPESVFLDLNNAKSISRIDIYTSSGYPLQNYTIQSKASPGAAWTTLVTVTGNTATYRTHTFAQINASSVQIICQLGPAVQTIYGRLNEVEIYGSVPTLPTIGVENGMLTLASNTAVVQAANYLAYKYREHDDIFLAQYPGKTAEEIAVIEETNGYNDDQPYIDFENQKGITSMRSVITAAEDNWLATNTTDATTGDPDTVAYEEGVRTLLNSYGEIKVGSIYYKFNNDGSYYVTGGPAQLIALRSQTAKSALPSGVTLVSSAVASPTVFPDPTCHPYGHRSATPSAGSWRMKNNTNLYSYPWGGRMNAKTKSYKKINGHWKKRRADIFAWVYGTVQNNQCAGAQYAEAAPESGLMKSALSKSEFGIIVQAYSGDVHSSHNHAQVGNYGYSITWPF